MKFEISRTSGYEVQPCDEAVREPYIRHDTRAVAHPADIPVNSGLTRQQAMDGWLRDGSNHRTINGRIVRDFPATAWFVTINSLDELMAFLDKYGRCVVSSSGLFNEDQPSIEIYDDYRE